MFNPLDTSKRDQDLFRNQYLELVYFLQMSIENGTATQKGLDYQLDDFCFKPILGKGCLVTSPMGFWKDDYNEMMADGDVKKTAQCIPQKNQTGRVCFDKNGIPVQVNAIFGGTTCNKDDSIPCAPCILDASAFVVTFLLDNNLYSADVAMEWEKQVLIRNIKTFNSLVDYNQDWPEGITPNEELKKQLEGVYERNPDMMHIKIDYLSERSIPDELEKIGAENVFVVIVSYCLMFIYVGMALGHFPSLVHNRFLLGGVGIVVVLSSLIIAIGLTLYWGIPLSLISSEVVPFLILAIGVDNMFIIVRAEREVAKEIVEVEERVALALKEVGPSIFTAAFCEALAFLVGMLTRVPALESFCLVAAIAVMADFLLQITVFAAALTLDAKRIRDNRCDILPFIKLERPREARKDIVRSLFQKYFVPALFTKKTEYCVFFTSGVLFILGIVACTQLPLGLNQNVMLPEGSDPFDYFNMQEIFGEVGPPAYLVFKNVDYTDEENLDTLSDIADGLSQANETVIKPVYSWVKTFQ